MTERTFLTKAEAAEYMRVSRATVDRLMKRRGLPFIKLEKKVLFRKKDIDAFLEKRLVK